MTESLTHPHASQTFVIFTQEQMQALSTLFFLLIRYSHQHPEPHQIERMSRDDCHEMHLLAAKIFGGEII